MQTTEVVRYTVKADFYCYELGKKGLLGLKDEKIDKECESSRSRYSKRSAIEDGAIGGRGKNCAKNKSFVDRAASNTSICTVCRYSKPYCGGMSVVRAFLWRYGHLNGGTIEAAWMAKWLGRRTSDLRIAGSIPDPGSQTVV